MNSFKIREFLRKIILDWEATLPKDEEGNEVRAAIYDTMITGGAIVSLLKDEEPNDYDVYFKNEESMKIVSNYYRRMEYAATKLNGEYQKAVESGLCPEKPKVTSPYVAWTSGNAISLSNKIQIITRFTGSADEIHENFDFMHCMCVFDYSANKVILPAEALECIITKELRWVNSKYPLCSLLRMNKFIRRGWWINAGQIVKICLKIHELDLKDPFILKEQLLGVDSAYFRALFVALKDKDEITCQMIFNLIDRAFYGSPDSEDFMEPEEISSEQEERN